MKKIYKPDYYDDFFCAAGDCPFTCCREWKIAVDPVTEEKWKNYSLTLGGKSIRPADCLTTDRDGDRKIKLKKDGFCPLLTDKGLCSIVLKYGEGDISTTCHTFPRETHDFADRRELTLAMGCPAALDLLWEGEKFGSIAGNDEDIFFFIRFHFIDLVNSKRFELSESMLMVFYIMREIYSLNYEKEEKTAAVHDVKMLFAPDFLSELSKAIRGMEKNTSESLAERNELFLDIADNYRKEGIYSDIIEPLAERAEEMECFFQKEGDDEDSGNSKADLLTAADEEVWKSLEEKLRILVAEEIYSTLVMPETDIYTMLLKTEWMGLTLAVLRHALFLKSQIKNISYEDLRLITAVIIRMTGYSEEDIEEYLDDCFEDLIWDFGYMALII